MLVRFSFENFKSFKNESCLDMEATSLKEHEYNLATTDTGNFLKIAAIYGANASGKSNVLEAFDFMRRKILISDDLKKTIPIDEDSIFTYMKNNKPIALEVELIANNNKQYKYGFEVLNSKILSEWLYYKKINKYYTIFEREANNIEMKDFKLANLINLDDESLFLNLYNKILKENDDFKEVYEWFLNTNYLDLGNPSFEKIINNRVSNNILRSEKYKNELTKFINVFDHGIIGFRTIPDNIEAINNNNTIELEVLRKNDIGEVKSLPFYMESNGTKKMFYLFDFIMTSLTNGTLLIIDELDAKLHPLLTRYIINLFHNDKINKGNGQLIYSTHDTVNLNKETFRRDEIWFTEKDDRGVSELYALSDYVLDDDTTSKKVRNDATYNKDYLSGRYGAIPILKEFDINYEEQGITI